MYKNNYVIFSDKGEFIMNEKENLNDITLFDMMKAVGKKWKMLLCITLAALLLCGGFGAFISYMNNQSYGTKIEFYVTSEKANRYILSLIQSDSFAEELLMDANGLPAEYKNTDSYKSALEIKNSITKLEEELLALEEELVHYPRKVSDAQKLSNDAQTAYTEIYNHLTIMYASADASNYKEQIIKAENDLAAAKLDKEEKKAAYNAILSEHEDKKEEVVELNKEIKELDESFDIFKAELMEKYRSVTKNSDKILKIKDSITYTYGESSDSDSQAALYVDVAVRKDKALAELIVNAIPEKMPEFISNNINQEINCVNMSAFSSAQLIEASPLIPTVIKYGIIGTALALFTACCVIVVAYLSKADKKDEE